MLKDSFTIEGKTIYISEGMLTLSYLDINDILEVEGLKEYAWLSGLSFSFNRISEIRVRLVHKSNLDTC